MYREIPQVSPEESRKFYPVVAGWLQKTLANYATLAQTVVSRAFLRLPDYFAPITLATSKVVLVDQMSRPPLSSWGFSRFADLELGNFSGITFLDTFLSSKISRKTKPCISMN